MKKLIKNISSTISPLPRKSTLELAAFAGVIILLVLVITLWRCGNGSSDAQKGHFEVTAVQVQKLKDIGQWEFLSISDEELIDTVRHGFFGDDRLTRLYYGTLRLGIDMGKTGGNWITTDHDTVKIVLPEVGLLDENFLDEARTRAIYESGKWSEADKAMLTIRAAEAMKTQCLTPQNISSAEQNAAAQFTTLLHSMGFKLVKVRFKKQKENQI